MTYVELKQRIEANGNVLTIRMEELRGIEGVGRLGPHVCTRIEEKLKSEGIGYYPSLKPDGWQEVRLFRLGTPMADVIHAAITPGDTADNRLREMTSDETASIISQIRVLVCD